HLHDAPERPRALFATHYHELTALVAERPRVRNFSVAVAEWKGEIVCLRQIVPRPAPRSYGVEVARLAGVPETVVARARALLAGLETGQGPVGRGPEPPAAQLSLFSAGEERIRRELAAVDPERLTPLEAVAVLARAEAEARDAVARAAHVRLEDPPQELGSDAGARVLDLESQTGAAVHDADLDLPPEALAHVLEGVSREVRHEARQDARLAGDRLVG